MKKNTSIKILLALLCAVVLFHLCILTKLIPYTIAWGGRLQSDPEMYVFESVSILVNLFLGVVVMVKAGFIKFSFKERVVNFILWCFFLLFVLNTIGNLFAKSDFEKSFSIVTLLFALLIWKTLKTKEG